MKYSTFLLVLSLSAVSLLAQPNMPPAVQAPAGAPAWSPSKDIGVFVFGKNGQSADQQLKDESDCYGAAKQQSGIDPKAPAAAGKTANKNKPNKKPLPRTPTHPVVGASKALLAVPLAVPPLAP